MDRCMHGCMDDDKMKYFSYTFNMHERKEEIKKEKNERAHTFM